MSRNRTTIGKILGCNTVVSSKIGSFLQPTGHEATYNIEIQKLYFKISAQKIARLVRTEAEIISKFIAKKKTEMSQPMIKEIK